MGDNTNIMMYQTEDGSTKIDVRIENESVWMTQKAIAELFKKSVNTINEHIKSILNYLDERKCSIRLPIIKKEGTRKIKRSIIHYNLDVVYNIAVKGQYFEEFNSFVSFLKINGIKKDFLNIIPIKERDFGEMLRGILKDVVEIHPQFKVGNYFVDFYIPEVNLGIEYDEKHHKKQIQYDGMRQKLIEKELNIQFIRVNEGEELQGINRVIKYLFKIYK